MLSTDSSGTDPRGRFVISVVSVRSIRATRKWSSLFDRTRPTCERPPKSTLSRRLSEFRSQVLAKGHVRAKLHQIRTGFLVDEERSRSIFALGDEPRRLAALVDDVDLRAAVDQELDHRGRPEIDPADDRGLPEVVGRVDVVSELEAVGDGV